MLDSTEGLLHRIRTRAYGFQNRQKRINAWRQAGAH